MAARETQAQKRAAAEGYKYESDSRWADYWSNVLIPQQMIDRPDVKRHFQLKFYQRYIVSFLMKPQRINWYHYRSLGDQNHFDF